MLLYVVFAERRSDFAAVPVGIAQDEDTARQLLTDAAASYCQVGSPIVRCRVRPRDLAPGEVSSMVRCFGLDDEAAGLTLAEAEAEAASRFPPAWREEYLDAFRQARQGV